MKQWWNGYRRGKPEVFGQKDTPHNSEGNSTLYTAPVMNG